MSGKATANFDNLEYVTVEYEQKKTTGIIHPFYSSYEDYKSTFFYKRRKKTVPFLCTEKNPILKPCFSLIDSKGEGTS